VTRQIGARAESVAAELVSCLVLTVILRAEDVPMVDDAMPLHPGNRLSFWLNAASV
jgi:hypothetical protein